MANMDKVKVAVRVRPFNRREVDLGTKCVVDMEDNQTVLYHPTVGFKEGDEIPQGSSKKQPKIFAFDNCFWSMNENNKKFANQEAVFNSLGKDILGRAFEGYNACIFAYGQTGSGKSYSMMGTYEQKGIIPRLCDTLFLQIAENKDEHTVYKVEVSYMEIYNERVRDLLDPKGKHNLKVREHNILGPYVDGLSSLAVSSFEDIDKLMSEGNKSRTVAATNMNSESSRSHAVFNIILTATLTDAASGASGEKVSKMSLVDLAGSERAQKTGAVGDRLREGSNINKSLSTLGLVISALADSGKHKNKFVPYRDSVLTWLLKDNLGGNSKTVMIATISPAADNYEETLSTLRYADRAKRIVNHAVVNEDPNARIIRELREEVDTLKEQLTEAQSNKAESLREKLNESEKLITDMTRTWEQKLEDTERIHTERQQALEKMGISVQSSGIKVGTGKYFLVNLNADPSLNELLVYYLKDDRTLVGRPGGEVEQDIQLNGLGIQKQHVVVDIIENEVYVTPVAEARTCINGKTISERTKCKHGDRLLLGNYHFFRINCPKTNSPSSETPQNIDYDFAQHELMIEEMSNDPVQTAIVEIEKSHERDKKEALQKQREKYERQMAMMRSQLLSPGTPSAPYSPFMPGGGEPYRSPSTFGLSGSTNNLNQQWAEERERTFKQSLAKLKEEVVRANSRVREANFLAKEMGKHTEFSVTLQIPAANLTPNRKKGAFVSEPAILVKRRSRASQVWAMEKFENKILDMRDMYEERKERAALMTPGGDLADLATIEVGAPTKSDPFYESQENHNLIGVANVFLEALFHDVKLDYHVPIISQQGEVAGRLHVELGRVSGVFPQDRQGDADSETSSGDGSNRNSIIELDEDGALPMGNAIVTRVHIKSAKGLPPALSNFVFCQYDFWGEPDPIIVAPCVNPDTKQLQTISGSDTFVFECKKEFTVNPTEEFVEHCSEGALSIEVWGHRSLGFGNAPTLEIQQQVQAKSRSIMDRWTELTRKLELWTEIHELNDQGEYVPVEHAPRPDVLTGGVFQLRQGHSRRIQVRVKHTQNCGTLPIIVESIQQVCIGCVTARSKLQKGLDSYQELDLTEIRERWTEALEKRRAYLDTQMKKIMDKEDKSDSDVEREKKLIEQWVCLTEERHAVLVPGAGTGIPGAPADWDPPPGMEEHVPVIFLDLHAESMTTPVVREGPHAAGVQSILPKEHGAMFFVLPPVKTSMDKDVKCVVSWDSSVHDSVHLNRLTPANERVYLILKVVVRLSHPAAMELVLRKRICINVYKRQSITDKLKKRMTKAVMYSMGADYLQDTQVAAGVTYEIVSNIPKASEDLEDRESLAQIAASQNEQTSDGETYIEKYIKGVSAVESILTLDKLRQEVAIKELMNSRGKSLQIRKATSVPNINSVLSPGERLGGGSSYDLSDEYAPERHGNMPKQYSLDALRQKSLGADFTKDIANKNFNLASPLSGMSPQPSKLHTPMKPLLEEQQAARPLLHRTDEELESDTRTLGHISESDEDEFVKFKAEQEQLKRTEQNMASDASNQSQALLQNNQSPSEEFTDFQEYKAADTAETEDKTTSAMTDMKTSSTSDSLADVHTTKGGAFTTSVTSSGYGSEAVSMQTLSSEDSASIRSLDDQTENGGAKSGSASMDKTDEVEDEFTVTSHESSGNSAESVVELGMESSLHEINADNPNDNDKTDYVTTDETRVADIDSNVDSDNTVKFGLDNDQSESAESNIQEKISETNSTETANQSLDMYSENMLDELENFNSELNDTFASPAPAKSNHSPHNEANSKAINDDVMSDNRDTNAVSNENSCNQSNTISESTQNESENKPDNDEDPVKTRPSKPDSSNPAKRLSWSETSDIVNAAIPENSSLENLPAEMKLRKSGQIDVSKVKKKSRPSEGSGKVKSAPSPMKATYRPVSMPVEALQNEEALNNSSGPDTDNDLEDDLQSVCSFGSRADLHRLGEAPVPAWIEPGVPVQVLFSSGGSKSGIVQFTGTTEFAGGNWVGVALDTAEGKNDGSVKGKRYFRCKKRHGIFVRHDKLIMDKKRKSSGGRLSEVRRSSGNLKTPSAENRDRSNSPREKPVPGYMRGTFSSGGR